MKSKMVNRILALAAAGGIASFLIGVHARAASPNVPDENNLHITKECPPSSGAAGGYCTILTSNVPAIKPGSKVIYDSAFGIPIPGYLDSNVLLLVGPGDWATGRCTIDGATGGGLCTFSDGVGQLSGFKARIKVSLIGPSKTAPGSLDFRWDGTYRFDCDRDY
jgi:hypothetical protein